MSKCAGMLSNLIRVCLISAAISACSQNSAEELEAKINADQKAFDRSLECPLALTVWRSLGREAGVIDKVEDLRLQAALSAALDRAAARGAIINKDRLAVEAALDNRMLNAFEELQEAKAAEAERLRNRWKAMSASCSRPA